MMPPTLSSPEAPRTSRYTLLCRHLQPIHPVECHSLLLKARDFDSSLKPGKSLSVVRFYRPISHLCTSSKILDKLFLNNFFLSFLFVVSRTVSNLFIPPPLNSECSRSLNHGQPTTRSLVAAIDGG